MGIKAPYPPSPTPPKGRQHQGLHELGMSGDPLCLLSQMEAVRTPAVVVFSFRALGLGLRKTSGSSNTFQDRSCELIDITPIHQITTKAPGLSPRL